MSKYEPYVVDDNESSCDDADVVDEQEEENEDELDTKTAIVSVFTDAIHQGGGNFTCGGKLQSNFAVPAIELIIPKAASSSSEEHNQSIASSSTEYEYKPIALPILSKEQANELISQCSKAPYGKGEKTIYDDKVRNSWQLSPSQFRISNKNWNEMLDELMNGELKRGLGIDENVKIKCSLYKLLLYEKGGHFEFHRDTEKEDQMFATLVIQLPSVYKGGNIIVKHGANEEVYDLSNESSYTPFYFSFYCDCKHKVDVVTSGYRTCLIYNVSYISGSKPILTDNTKLVTTFNNIVEDWSLVNPMMCYLLEHKYSKAGLSFDCLKGADSKILQLIKQYNVKHPELAVEVFLGIMTKSQQGYGDPDDITWEDIHYFISHMIDENNQIITDIKEFNLKESDIIPEEALEELEQSGEDIEEDTGNEGATASRWYKSACLIIYPKKFKYLMALRFGGSNASRGLVELWKAYKENPSLRDQLVKYLKDYITTSRVSESIGKYIVKVNELTLAKLLLSKHGCCDENAIQLARGFGIDSLRNEITNYFRKRGFNSLAEFLDVVHDNTLAQLLIPELLIQPSYLCGRSPRYDSVVSVCAKFNINLDVETRKKILSRSSLDTSQLYELGCKLKDVYCLHEVLKRSFSNNYNYYLNRSSGKLPVKIIVNCIQTIGLDNCRALLAQLISQFASGNNISSCLDTIHLFNDNTDNVHVTDFITKSLVKQIMLRSDLKSQNIDIYENIFIQFYKCGAIDEMNGMAKLLLSQTTQFIHSTINPLLLKISRTDINVINSQPVQNLIRKCIQYYDAVITKQSNIPTPNNWIINAALTCTCNYCRECTNFLKSPTETTHLFKATLHQRDHIEGEAKKATIDLQYETLRQGSPHTLKLTKIRKSEELKQRALKEATTARCALSELVNNNGGSSGNNPPTKKVKSENK